MEDSWELVSVPSEIQHSTISKETPDENTEISQENNEGSSKSKVNNSTCIVRSCFNERLNSGTRKCVFSSRTAASSLRPQVHTWETVLKMYGSWWIFIIINNVVDNYVPVSKSTPLPKLYHGTCTESSASQLIRYDSYRTRKCWI